MKTVHTFTLKYFFNLLFFYYFVVIFYFLGHHGETRGGALSPELKMKTLLKYLADPGFQSGIGEELGIHQFTVSKTITEVMHAVNNRTDFGFIFLATTAKSKKQKLSGRIFMTFQQPSVHSIAHKLL
jgi:hypothetical protein